jgi:hypothetical protein
MRICGEELFGNMPEFLRLQEDDVLRCIDLLTVRLHITVYVCQVTHRMEKIAVVEANLLSATFHSEDQIDPFVERFADFSGF